LKKYSNTNLLLKKGSRENNGKKVLVVKFIYRLLSKPTVFSQPQRIAISRNSGHGSPGLSSHSSSGFETLASSSMSSMFESHMGGGGQAVLESIRETSPMTNNTSNSRN
jgi:hypothetical protein